jgi:mevalonate pyrophosphate decarboxylase
VRAKDSAGNYDTTAATFTWTVANPGVVMIGSRSFDSLAAALTASVNGDILRLQAAMPPAAVNFSGSGSRTLQGGYDTMFGSQSGTTTLQLLKVISGTVIVDGIAIN